MDRQGLGGTHSRNDGTRMKDKEIAQDLQAGARQFPGLATMFEDLYEQTARLQRVREHIEFESHPSR